MSYKWSPFYVEAVTILVASVVLLGVAKGMWLPHLTPCSSSSANLFSHDRYVCHPTAIVPANMDLYSIGTNVKLMAVTAGHNLIEFIRLMGTVFLTRSQLSARVSPAKSACIPKKYVLKTGVKTHWLTVIFAASERRSEE